MLETTTQSTPLGGGVFNFECESFCPATGRRKV